MAVIRPAVRRLQMESGSGSVVLQKFRNRIIEYLRFSVGVGRLSCPLKPYLLTFLLVFSSTAVAWQLNPMSLEDRVRDASLVVVGTVERVHSRRPSDIAGVGNVWTVSLRVNRALKGTAPSDTLHITFSEVAVEDMPNFDPAAAHVYLLNRASGGSDRPSFSAPASYLSVLTLASEAPIRAFLKSSGLLILMPPPVASFYPRPPPVESSLGLHWFTSQFEQKKEIAF